MQRRDILRLGAALAAVPFIRPAFAQTPAPRWTTAAAPTVARQELYPEVLDGRLYVAGGLLTPNTGYSAHFESYDPATDAWTRLATLPEARHHIALAATGGLLYGVGGFSGGFPNWRAQASAYVYDPRANRWRDSTPIPYPTAEGVFAAIAERLYLVGGRVRAHDDARHFNDHADTARSLVFNPANGRWSAIADAPTARNSAAAAVIGGRLFVVGGRQAIKQADGSLRQVNAAQLEVYDPRTDRWSQRAPMPQAQGGLAAAAHGGRLYVFGGEQWVPEQKVFANAWVYEPASDRWSALPPLPTPRHGLGAAVIGNRIHVVGGGLRVGGDQASAVHEVLVLPDAQAQS
ncbi:ring canal Kelch protein [Bordetella genomosp. 5]|uniref:Kelch repeat-containing protein n=1 Tax=Bordetella genomosp. 5 TaxID=1395608 RepID=UPI000B9E88C0|nr:kelch repeat-containing protein [Bordetella genomosp. 5]OZI47293.1 ring canal Kelch protein [Bordetella genomosp. 5]